MPNDLTGIPTSTEGLSAANNQFQKPGPKGFIQMKVLENDKLYVRVGLPGVPNDPHKIIFFSGEASRDVDVPEYSDSAGLACDCCEITDKMKDGVLRRMIVTREEFNAFHEIDRDLFTRLVLGLKRDITQSFEVFAFLYTLENTGYVRNLIEYLVSLPDAYVDAVANEVVMCLTFLDNTTNNSSDVDGESIIPLMIHMSGGRISLMFIQQNRDTFLVRMRNHLNHVFFRAFDDICIRAQSCNNEKISVQQERVHVEEESEEKEPINRMSGHVPPCVDAESEEEEVGLAPDDRTVFLTFSRAYPISKEEVRVLFTKRFGDLIEEIKMEEVQENKHPLFAKMVLKMIHASKIEEILSGRSRKKFKINGKDVWARKYFRRP